MSNPMVSVVIPTHNRQMYLRMALDALTRQTFPTDRFEVLVVLDGCSDGSEEMLRNYRAPYRLRMIKQEQSGASASRNHGASSASGGLLIFLDDDIEATPGLIQAHVNAHRGAGNRVVLGYYPPALAGNKSLLSLELLCWWEELFHDMQETGHRSCYKDVLSGNISIPREIFESVGGFDPNLPVHEDYDLGMHLIQANLMIIFEPEALGLHHEQAVIKKSMHRKFLEGITDVRMGRKHPELISTLPIWQILKYARFPSRMLQHLQIHSPGLANWIASKATLLLPGVEKVHLVGTWRRILFGLLAYWYWKGIVQELPTWKAVQAFAVDPANPTRTDRKSELIIDLSLGLDQAEQTLDRERPDSVEMFFGDNFIGRLPHQPGAERWRGAHLRPYLVNHFPFQLLETFAIQGIINLPVNVKEINVFTQNDVHL